MSKIIVIDESEVITIKNMNQLRTEFKILVSEATVPKNYFTDPFRKAIVDYIFMGGNTNTVAKILKINTSSFSRWKNRFYLKPEPNIVENLQRSIDYYDITPLPYNKPELEIDNSELEDVTDYYDINNLSDAVKLSYDMHKLRVPNQRFIHPDIFRYNLCKFLHDTNTPIVELTKITPLDRRTVDHWLMSYRKDLQSNVYDIDECLEPDNGGTRKVIVESKNLSFDNSGKALEWLDQRIVKLQERADHIRSGIALGIESETYIIKE